jgi:hypothetical protein
VLSPEVSARIRRFERLGGIDLSPDSPEKHAVLTGVAEEKVGFTFVCPVCGRRERNNQEMSPACTGPSWTDDHPMEPMMRVET